MTMFSGAMPQRTFAGREGLDLSGEKGAGNEEAGLLADSIKLFGMFTAAPTAGKAVVCNDESKIPNEAVPFATDTQAGGVKVGNGLVMNSGVLSVAGAATSNLVANNGHRKYEDGFMEEWGYSANGNHATVVFPVEFVELFAVYLTYTPPSGYNDNNIYDAKVKSKSNTQFTAFLELPAFWRAIGRWK
jgi:hypothetical protein